MHKLFLLFLHHALFIISLWSLSVLTMGLTTKPPDTDRKSSRVRIERPNLESQSAPSMATIQDDDELLLARIGYKQVCTLDSLNKSSN
jgi:hypothetical protein